MAENEPTVDGASPCGAPPRRQSARIRNKKRAEMNHLAGKEKNVPPPPPVSADTAATSNETNATEREIVETEVAVVPKKESRKEYLARRRFQLLLDDDVEDSTSSLKRTKSENVRNEEQKDENSASAVEIKDNLADDDNGEVLNSTAENGLWCVNIDDAAEKIAYANVKEILRLFNKYYLQSVEEEEKMGRHEMVENKSRKSTGKHKKEHGNENATKKTPKRPDMKAAAMMMTKPMGDALQMVKNDPILNLKKRIGHIPGVRVGHQFFSRAEMVVVGFHSLYMSGIDYIGKDCIEEEYKHLNLPVAVAIVLSGMYEDDVDNAEDIVYTGQGGHDLTGNKRQIRDQKMVRGNLALKNCMMSNLPVRVVRGHKDQNSYTGKVYTYDGLYKVIDYWSDKGISGYSVYKFKLRRLLGQATLTTNQVQFAYGSAPKSISDLPGLVCKDITDGQENFPIPATNLVDDPPVPPSGFKYTNTIQVAENVVFPATAPGCSCKGGSCIDPKSCACAKLNGGDFPYVARGGGRLIEAKDVVYECGPNCGCGPECINRVSQRGLRHHLEVFRAPRKGWGVRSWDLIPIGAPVCEYIGILKKSEDVESDLENNYIFDIDCLQTMRGIDGRNKRSGDLLSNPSEAVADQSPQGGQKSEAEFCIDAGRVGNIARFINHSCEPNLFVQCVVSSHHDMKLARVVLFAAENIPRRQELTYDYGYVLDSVLEPNGKVKKMPCYCGATGCRKRLF